MRIFRRLNMRKQMQRVLDYIDEFGSITSLEAFKDLGITRLSAVIFDLRKAGYNIDDKTETQFNRYGEKAHFSRYFIPKETQLTLF